MAIELRVHLTTFQRWMRACPAVVPKEACRFFQWLGAQLFSLVAASACHCCSQLQICSGFARLAITRPKSALP
jgi:hypothetical protein